MLRSAADHGLILKYTGAFPAPVIAAHLSPSAAHFLSMPKCSFHSLVPGKLAVTRH